MEKKIGGQWTERGVYISLRTGEFVTIPKEGGELPGTAAVRYIRTPAAVAAILGPIVGLAYVIFLPLIGIVAAVWLVGRQAARGVQALRRKAAELTGAEWQPGMSYFARRRKAREQEKEAGAVEETRKEE